MQLKRRKNKSGQVWFCEWWDPAHRTQVLGPASGPGALSRKQASQLLSDLSTVVASARSAMASGGLHEFCTIEAAAAEWFDACERDWQPNTRANYRSALKRILPALGGMRLNELRSLHVQRLFQDLAETGSARGTLAATRGALSSMLRWLDDQQVSVSFRMPRLPRTARAPKETEPLTPEEIAAVMARDGWIGTAERLMLGCGLRRGEALALRHCDVIDGSLRIARSLGPCGIGPTKTKTVRTVPLPSVLAEEVAAIPGTGEDLLFPEATLTRLRRGGTVNSRRFRRTFAQLLDADVDVVRATLGHTKIDMTLAHYRSASRESVAEAVDRLQTRLRKAG